MLRITTVQECKSTTIRLEGRLVGPWVQELKACWRRLRVQPLVEKLAMDLNGVLFVDAQGKALLKRMHRAGVNLSSHGIHTQYVLEQIKGNLHH